jgi:invasion protein IalB
MSVKSAVLTALATASLLVIGAALAPSPLAQQAAPAAAPKNVNDWLLNAGSDAERFGKL